MHKNVVVILGTTASGKTALACALAEAIGGEIISADSRQVYRHLNIGSGKDLDSYQINGKKIPYHLIDLISPGEQYYLHQFVADLKNAFLGIRERGHWPIVCGGTGLYLDALHKDFSYTKIPEDLPLRKKLGEWDKETLLSQLKTFPKAYWEKVDLNSKKRIIRGIEIARYKEQHGEAELREESLHDMDKPIYFGLTFPREVLRERIARRLSDRLKGGMIEEVEGLLAMGVDHQRLQRFGLEYKFVSLYLMGELNYESMEEQLAQAINQFAKRQMTWYRKMEKEGIAINWLEEGASLEEKLAAIMKRITV